MRFLDTNILLYSVSRIPGEERKRAEALAILQRDDLALSVQVLQEFYVQATRPSRPDRLPHEIVCNLIESWLRLPVQDVTVPILKRALALRSQHRLSYWDCTIIASARALGCEDLYSEDMSHGQIVDGVRIVNPFR